MTELLTYSSFLREIMGEKNKLITIFSVLFIVAVVLTGCALPDKKTESPERLYITGVDRLIARKNLLFSASDYEGAEIAFKKIKENYSFSIYAPLAELRLADIHFEREEFEEAVAEYNEFITLHPKHDDVPYAFYQLGLSYFNQTKGVDRDQPAVEKALSYFEILRTKYPASEYIEEVSEKIATCKDLLAGHELYVGKYYYKNKQYKGAAERFKRSLELFPGFGPKEDALFYLGKSYLASDSKAKGRSAFQRLIQAFPKSVQANEARAILENIGTDN